MQSKENMPRELEEKCGAVIRIAKGAAMAAGAVPIPAADVLPITAAQVTMIVALGKVFGVTISDSAAKAIMGVELTYPVGRTILGNVLKMVPVAGWVAGGIIEAGTAAKLTEALGWMMADDFYRMSQGREPENLAENAKDIKEQFAALRFSKKG